MHPIIERDIMQTRVADLHRQAQRDRMARAAALTPHTRQEKRRRRTRLAPGRLAVLARRVLRPSPTR